MREVSNYLPPDAAPRPFGASRVCDALKVKRRGALVLALVLAFGALAAFAGAGQARATDPASALTVLAGRVDLAHGAAGYIAARDGDTVVTGDRVRTDDIGRALVTFFDGSTLDIAAAAEVTISSAASRDGAVDLIIPQAIGRTFSSVHKLTDARSRYEIRTPSLTAAVRGTKFEVGVAADGSATERTTEGLVAVRSAGTEVLVPAGAQTGATPGSPPAPPAPIPHAPATSPSTLPAATPTATTAVPGPGSAGVPAAGPRPLAASSVPLMATVAAPASPLIASSASTTSATGPAPPAVAPTVAPLPTAPLAPLP